MSLVSGIKLGVQSYSFRKFSFEETLKFVSDLGLKYIEAYSGHLPPRKEEALKAKELSNKYGVKIIAHGVNHMPPDKKVLRGLFEFAHSLGIEVLTADPDPESFDILDELVDEYGIAVAIHNHGPRHRYGTIESILKAVEGHSELIGMCLDTGHLARAGEDPAEAVKKLGRRIHGLHLKDVNEEKKDVILGKGILNLKSVFEALKEVGMLNKAVIVIEYELEPENPLPGIRKSLDYIVSIIRSL